MNVEWRFLISFLHLLKSPQHTPLPLSLPISLCLASFIHVLLYIVVSSSGAHLFVDLSQEPIRERLVDNLRDEREEGRNILIIPKQRILLVSNLNRTSTILFLCQHTPFLIHLLPPTPFSLFHPQTPCPPS
jgi:hypothetical protein